MKFLHKSTNPSTGEVFNNPNWGKIVLWILVTIILLVVFFKTAGDVIGVINKLQATKQELQFAYDHPAIVKFIREDFATKSAELEKSYLKQDKSAQDKLLEAVTDQLQTKK